MPNPPAELTNYVANAYNAKDGNFLSSLVFKLTYSGGQTVQWGAQGQADIPDQISASAGTTFYSASTSLLMESTADYDRTFSATVSAEYAGVTYSGSVQSSLLYHGSLFSSTSSAYALNFYLQSLLTFERKPFTASDLDSAFVAALSELPTDISAAGQAQKYYDFFDAFGTHYTTLGTLGGTIVMESDISDELFETSTRTEVSTAISAGYNGVVNSGRLSVEAAYASSEFLSTHRSEVSITLNVMGGLYAPDATISAWQQSLYNSPVLVFNVPTKPSPQLTTLTCISSLVAVIGASPTIATNIEEMIHSYINQALVEDGLLSTPTVSGLSQVYDTARGDGFVMTMIQSTADGARGYIHCYDDNDSNPTTLRGCASQHKWLHKDHWLGAASAMMPTPHGTTYTTQAMATGGDPTVTVKHCGLGNIDDEGLGAWETLALGQAVTATSDGFVVAYIDYNGEDGARGSIECQLQSGAAFQTVAASSQHFWSGADMQVPCNSFCMPIRSGSTYQVVLTSTHGNPVGQAFFVPLSAQFALFADPQTRTPDRTYQAQSDGFLVAYIHTDRKGDRGQVALYTHADNAELMSLGLLAATSVHFYPHSDTYVAQNTATIPVAKGNYYKVASTLTAGQPAVEVLWIALGAGAA